MDSVKKQRINIAIADRTYPLQIDPADEERIRKAAKKINETIAQYQERKYSTKDIQDYLAMVALQYASKLLASNGDKSSDAQLSEEIGDVDKMLTDLLLQARQEGSI